MLDFVVVAIRLLSITSNVANYKNENDIDNLI